MSPEMQENLDYSSKINRDSKHIDLLIQDGEKQGNKFLENL
jgi:hypothetical protein